MSIDIAKEPDGLGPHEHCCFCRVPTAYWSKTDVAVCPECAEARNDTELPTKQQWCAKEAKLERRPWQPHR